MFRPETAIYPSIYPSVYLSVCFNNITLHGPSEVALGGAQISLLLGRLPGLSTESLT